MFAKEYQRLEDRVVCIEGRQPGAHSALEVYSGLCAVFFRQLDIPRLRVAAGEMHVDVWIGLRAEIYALADLDYQVALVAVTRNVQRAVAEYRDIVDLFSRVAVSR